MTFCIELCELMKGRKERSMQHVTELKQRVIMRGGIALTPVGRPSGLAVRREDKIRTSGVTNWK